MIRDKNKVDADLQQKLAAFRKITVKHKRLMEARELLLPYLLDEAEEGSSASSDPQAQENNSA